MCGPTVVKKVVDTEGPEETLLRPADDLRDEPIKEAEPEHLSYQIPHPPKPAESLNQEMMIKRKQAQGFSK